LTHPFKLKKVAKLCAGSGEVMVIPTHAFDDEASDCLKRSDPELGFAGLKKRF